MRGVASGARPVRSEKEPPEEKQLSRLLTRGLSQIENCRIRSCQIRAYLQEAPAHVILDSGAGYPAICRAL